MSQAAYVHSGADQSISLTHHQDLHFCFMQCFSIFHQILVITFSIKLQQFVLLFLNVVYSVFFFQCQTSQSDASSSLTFCGIVRHQCFLFSFSLLPIGVSAGLFKIFNTKCSRKHVGSNADTKVLLYRLLTGSWHQPVTSRYRRGHTGLLEEPVAPT